MAVNIQYEAPAWNQIYEMLLAQAQKIQGDHYKPDIIVSVARGGLVPARILSDLLETPRFCNHTNRILLKHQPNKERSNSKTMPKHPAKR